ncbi:hypothetical protein [Breoghania sp. JC706]|uniref:hypothetical protein n=1 Tax=Breoghania sp. JC706 TaxID=3117732 RepID=UPI003009E752
MNTSLRARRTLAGILAACLLGGALAAWVTARVSERLMLDEIGLRAAASLDLQAATLESLLDKYRILPPILSRRPDVVALSRARDTETAHRIAATAAGMTGAEEIRFLAEDGSLIGSSDIDAVGTALDTEIRQAVEQAREGRLGRQLLVTAPGKLHLRLRRQVRCRGRGQDRRRRRRAGRSRPHRAGLGAVARSGAGT